ncbi:unnamed protein product [Rhizophagus irregularis]|nr:unnamed protein product [Rhizophagus irregularis]
MIVEKCNTARWNRLIETNRMVSRSITPRKMILPPFDSSRLGDSKELLIIFLQSLDAEKLSKTFSGAVNINQRNIKMPIWDVSLNISPANDCRKMKLPPFDSSQ